MSRVKFTDWYKEGIFMGSGGTRYADRAYKYSAILPHNGFFTKVNELNTHPTYHSLAVI